MSVQFHKANEPEDFEVACNILRAGCPKHGWPTYASKKYVWSHIKTDRTRVKELHHFFLPNGTELGYIGFEDTEHACVTLFTEPRLWSPESVANLELKDNKLFAQEGGEK